MYAQNFIERFNNTAIKTNQTFKANLRDANVHNSVTKYFTK